MENIDFAQKNSRTQDLPIFVRMVDRDSIWGLNNGLPTIVTTTIQMNLNGYTLVLPDMIGGNGYNLNHPQADLPTKELFIRWVQANTFLPVMQYSFAPWNFDNEVLNTYTSTGFTVILKLPIFRRCWRPHPSCIIKEFDYFYESNPKQKEKSQINIAQLALTISILEFTVIFCYFSFILFFCARADPRGGGGDSWWS